MNLRAMQLNQGLQRMQHGFYRGSRYAVPDEVKYSTPTCDGTGAQIRERHREFNAFHVRSGLPSCVLSMSSPLDYTYWSHITMRIGRTCTKTELIAKLITEVDRMNAEWDTHRKGIEREFSRRLVLLTAANGGHFE